MKDLFQILDAMLARRADVEDARELYLDIAERIARHVSSLFGARLDEVAILTLTGDGKHLGFVAPRKLASLGTIPLSKPDSIAVSVFNKKVADVTNNVPLVKHVAFFESVKLREVPRPIQKMVTVPIMAGSETVGVAQVSRKGDAPRDAGPDFGPSDAQKAEALFAQVGHYLRESRPAGF